MSTDPAKPDPAKPTPAPPAGTVEAPPAPAGDGTGFADRLSSGWQSFRAGQVISYRWMAFILLVVTAAGVGWYIWSESRKAESAKWVALNELNSLDKLQQFQSQYPGTAAARVARMDEIRVLLGPQGLAVLRPRGRLDFASPRPDDAARKAAADNVEKARDLAEQAAGGELKDDPTGRAECLYLAAVAEGELIGIPKGTGPGEYRGSVEKLIERLEAVAAAVADDNPWGQWARGRAAHLRQPSAADEYVQFQRNAYVPLPDFKGGFPGGSPDLGGLGGLGGIPGGGP